MDQKTILMIKLALAAGIAPDDKAIENFCLNYQKLFAEIEKHFKFIKAGLERNLSYNERDTRDLAVKTIEAMAKTLNVTVKLASYKELETVITFPDGNTVVTK